jgi:hypothetical protein
MCYDKVDLVDEGCEGHTLLPNLATLGLASRSGSSRAATHHSLFLYITHKKKALYLLECDDPRSQSAMIISVESQHVGPMNFQ